MKLWRKVLIAGVVTYNVFALWDAFQTGDLNVGIRTAWYMTFYRLPLHLLPGYSYGTPPSPNEQNVSTMIRLQIGDKPYNFCKVWQEADGSWHLYGHGISKTDCMALTRLWKPQGEQK